jgi:hypothetical protein
MKLGGLTIAAAVLAALSGLLYWSNHRPAPDAAASAISPAILTINPADITAIKIQQKGQDEVALATDPKGQWGIAAPKIMDADQDAAGGVVTTLSSLSAQRIVEDKASDLQTYGLNDPAVTVDITEKGNKTQKLLLGNDAPIGGAVYAALQGDPRVFTVAGNVKASLAKGLGHLRDTRLFRVTPDQINKIDLKTKKQDILFERTKDSWQIDQPPSVRADPMRVDQLAQQLADAKFDASHGQASADEAKLAASFASGDPVATATVTAMGGQQQQLQVRKVKDEYLAKSTVTDGIYEVPAAVGQSLDKNIDDFRNKKIFDFGFQTPSKVELHDGPKTYLFTRTGQDWFNNGTKMDVVNTLILVDRIRSLSAEKQVTSGFGAPAIDIAVTGSDGSKTEKVAIAKNGADYVAKREGESGLYALSTQDVQGLEQAAADVKPPAAEPAAK